MVASTTLARMALFGMLCALSACATDGKVSQVDPVPATNNENGVALKGYDPVGYFTESKPEVGSPAITTQWHGATYRFASEEHRDAFLSQPDHYAPQYGGFCAFAISRGTIADIDPAEWAVQNNRLYLNNNPVAQQIWDVDRPGNIHAGDKNWPLVPKLPVNPG